MEKRVIIAVLLSFVVLYVYQAMFAPKPVQRPKPAPAAQAAGSAAPAAGQSAAPAPGTPAQPGAAAAAPPGAQAAAAATVAVVAVADTEEREVLIETESLHAVFSNRGAVLKSWRLKTYKDKAGRPVDLVPQTLKDDPKPFGIRTGSDAVDARANSALFRVDGGGASLDPRTGTYRAGFEYREQNGISLRKVFTVDPKTFTVHAVIEASVGGSPANVAVVMGPGPGDIETSEASRYMMGARANLYRAGKVERHDAAALDRQPVLEGAMRWAGVDDHYFMSTVLARTGNVRIEYAPRRTQDALGKTTHTFVGYTVDLAGPGVDATFFIGPKAFDVLKDIDRREGLDGQFVLAIDYGMFRPIVVPLLNALKWVNGYLGNYGWSIIGLTFLINLALLPLRHKSVVSMRKMQELQPEIKAIQDRYGKLKTTDPERQKMNQELMELYKQRGVNPASGCVPMLLTMPILFAFYNMLAYSIELRGAPFGLWIKDLAAYDPYYVAPILTGITMLVQQRMTPQTGTDPMQQKMFMMMPVVFTVMFLWAPAGLNIYWLVNNLLAIGQQYFTNRLIGPPRVPARALAEKRPAKK